MAQGSISCGEKGVAGVGVIKAFNQWERHQERESKGGWGKASDSFTNFNLTNIEIISTTSPKKTFSLRGKWRLQVGRLSRGG